MKLPQLIARYESGYLTICTRRVCHLGVGMYLVLVQHTKYACVLAWHVYSDIVPIASNCYIVSSCSSVKFLVKWLLLTAHTTQTSRHQKCTDNTTVRNKIMFCFTSLFLIKLFNPIRFDCSLSYSIQSWKRGCFSNKCELRWDRSISFRLHIKFCYRC